MEVYTPGLCLDDDSRLLQEHRCLGAANGKLLVFIYYHFYILSFFGDYVRYIF
jgi:hypothetical protein